MSRNLGQYCITEYSSAWGLINDCEGPARAGARRLIEADAAGVQYAMSAGKPAVVYLFRHPIVPLTHVPTVNPYSEACCIWKRR